MTVLDFDPPQQKLRLVSTTGSTGSRASRRDERYRSSAVLYGDARALYREVLQAAMFWGQAIDADSLRVVLATKQANHGAAPIREFTSAGIWQLMFVDVVAWCRNRKLDVPHGCVQALTTTINYLEASETLDLASDDVISLHDAIEECTGGWCEPHPASPPGSKRSLRSKRGTKRT